MVNGKPGPAKGSPKPMKPAGEPDVLWREYLNTRRPRADYWDWKGRIHPELVAPEEYIARATKKAKAAVAAVPNDLLDEWEAEVGAGAGLQGIPPEELLRRSETANLRAELAFLKADNARKERVGRNVLYGLSGVVVLALLAYAFGLF